jgi:hypothetical protein
LLAADCGGRPVEGDREEDVSSQPDVKAKPEADPAPAGSAPGAGVGERCRVADSAATSNSATIRVHARECATGACLRLGLGTPLCTASCATASDCPLATPHCPSGFVCEAAIVTSAIGCCKMCLCQTDAASWLSFAPKYCAGVTPNCTALQTAKTDE